MKPIIIASGLIHSASLLSGFCAAATLSQRKVGHELSKISESTTTGLDQDPPIDPRFTVARFEFEDTPIDEIMTYSTFVQMLANVALEDFRGWSRPRVFEKGDWKILAFSLREDRTIPRKFLVWGLLSAINAIAAAQRFVKSVFTLMYDGDELGIVEIAPRIEGEDALVLQLTDIPQPLARLNITNLSISNFLVQKFPAEVAVTSPNEPNLSVSDTQIEFYGQELSLAEFFIPILNAIGLLAPRLGRDRFGTRVSYSPQIRGVTEMSVDVENWRRRALRHEGPYFLNQNAIMLLKDAAGTAIYRGTFKELIGTCQVPWHVQGLFQYVKVGKIAIRKSLGEQEVASY